MNEAQIVDYFSKEMLKKIEFRHNRYAPLGWKTLDIKRLVKLLKGEIEELEEAIEKNEPLGGEAVDIANYALFIYENSKENS